MATDLKTDARNAAAGSAGNFVLAYYVKGAAPRYEPVSDRVKLDDAYGKLADTPELFDYVAAFDKTDPAWPEPWAEFGPAVRTIPVQSSPPKIVTKEVKVGSGWGIVAGFFGGLLGIAALTRKKRG